MSAQNAGQFTYGARQALGYFFQSRKTTCMCEAIDKEGGARGRKKEGEGEEGAKDSLMVRV